MPKAFTRWPRPSFPYTELDGYSYIDCKYGRAEVVRIVVDQDDAWHTHAPGVNITEVTLRWQWHERPRFPLQFQLQFDGPGNPVIDVDQDAGNVQTYPASVCYGAKSFKVMVNQDPKQKKDIRKTWYYEDDRGFFQFNYLTYETGALGPVLSRANFTFAYAGSRYFGDPGSFPEVGVVVTDTNNGRLGSLQLPANEEFGAPAQTYDIGLPTDFTGANRMRKPWGDRFLEFYKPPAGVGTGRGFARMTDLPYDHVGLFVLLFEQTVQCPLFASDFLHPLQLATDPVVDTPGAVLQSGQETLTSGFYAGRQVG